jgi:hypothetical protein
VQFSAELGWITLTPVAYLGGDVARALGPVETPHYRDLDAVRAEKP